MPKVACTGWKMWLRTMLGLPDPLNQYLAHSYENSGLGDLSKSFQEEHAVRLMTRPDMFKFVLVRNPFTRIPSTYLNKLVYTDAPDRTEGWGTRKFWNKVCAENLPTCRELAYFLRTCLHPKAPLSGS